MFEFESHDGLQQLGVEVGENTTGDAFLMLRRSYRGQIDEPWESDGELTLWPDDPVRDMAEFLIAAWSAQAKAQGERRT